MSSQGRRLDHWTTSLDAVEALRLRMAEVEAPQEDPVSRRRIGQNPRVGTARHRDVLECVRDREEVFERAGHRPLAGPAGKYKRAVDVEEDDGG